MDEAYIIALLEQIAYNTQKGPLEREVYLKGIRDNVSTQKEAGGVFGAPKEKAIFGTIFREQGGSGRTNTKVLNGQTKTKV